MYAPQAPKYSAGNHWVNLPGSTPADPNWDTGSYSVETTPQSTCLRDALKGLDSMIARYSVDTTRMYIGGGSMGGYGTYDVLCRGNYTRFACALPVSGGGDTSKAKLFKDLPLWAFADSSDNIIPFKFQAQMVKALHNAGGTPKVGFYSDAFIEAAKNYGAKMGGHIWNIPFTIDSQIMPWIFAQKKAGTSIEVPKNAQVIKLTIHQARSLVTLGSFGATAVGVRLEQERAGIVRAFDLQGRPLAAQRIYSKN